MFYYLSFLRPPPAHCGLSGSITLTPQIANDLRTEHFDGVQDIFYSWSAVDRNINSGQTKSMKLTTWRKSNAYKELNISLPPNPRDGQTWRLILTAPTATAVAQGGERSHYIDLTQEFLGSYPLPVISMPIFFSRQPQKLVKQEQIERIFILPRTSLQDVAYLIIREQTSFDLDKKIWDSGIGLSAWIASLRHRRPTSATISAQVHQILFSRQRCNILELGAGTGIVGIVICALRSALDTTISDKSQTIITDLSSAMPLLEHNISANKELLSLNVEPMILDWNEEILPSRLQDLEHGFDIIIMADVTYNTSSFPALVRTLSSLIRLSQLRDTSPLILLGYKERDPAERMLWHMAADIGLFFEKIGEKAGAGGAPVEIWLGICK